jgi:hypothetical protein
MDVSKLDPSDPWRTLYEQRSRLRGPIVKIHSAEASDKRRAMLAEADSAKDAAEEAKSPAAPSLPE